MKGPKKICSNKKKKKRIKEEKWKEKGERKGEKVSRGRKQ